METATASPRVAPRITSGSAASLLADVLKTTKARQPKRAAGARAGKGPSTGGTGGKEVLPGPKNKPTATLRIDNFVRPFTHRGLKAFLEESGTLVAGGLWLNKIKTHCYATFESVDQAQRTLSRVHGKRLPRFGGQVLSADYSTTTADKAEEQAAKQAAEEKAAREKRLAAEAEAREARRKAQAEARAAKDARRKEEIEARLKAAEERRKRRKAEREARRASGAGAGAGAGAGPGDLSVTITRQVRGRGAREAGVERRTVRPKPVEEAEPAPLKTLDDLFRKTDTKPALYYLPASAADVRRARRQRRQFGPPRPIIRWVD